MVKDKGFFELLKKYLTKKTRVSQNSKRNTCVAIVLKEVTHLGEKGNQTKRLIKKAAYRLFAEKGFNAVTMKDICEDTGLSRGGLYRHYAGTAQIFEELFRQMSAESIDEFSIHMKNGIPMQQIFNEVSEQLRAEMIDASNSLSLAIYEYSNTVNKDLFLELNEIGTQKWRRLLSYGIERKEIQNISIDQAVDMILYSYQGVRMWSRVIPITEEVADRIVNIWKEMLFE